MENIKQSSNSPMNLREIIAGSKGLEKRRIGEDDDNVPGPSKFNKTM